MLCGIHLAHLNGYMDPCHPHPTPVMIEHCTFNRQTWILVLPQHQVTEYLSASPSSNVKWVRGNDEEPL